MVKPASTMVWCLAMALLSVPAAMADIVLARVDGEPVTLDQLKFEFERRHQGHMQLLGDEAVLRDFLEGAIRRRLFTQEARRMGLGDSPRIRRRVADERARVGTEWLYRTEVEEQVEISDAMLEAALEKVQMSYELTLVETDSLDAARTAWRRIDGGEPAEAVARELSQAPSRLRGGLQGVAWGRTDMPALEEALIGTAVGDLLEPVAIERGWVVARVEKVERLELKNPEVSRNVVTNVLRMRAIADRRERYLEGLRDRYEVRIDAELLDPVRLLALAGAAPPGGDDPVVATWRGGRLGIGEFAAGIRKETFARLRPGQQRLQAEQLLSNRIDQEVLRLEVDARWADAPAAAHARVETLENDLIFRELLGGVVFSEIDVTDDEIAAWYAEHPDDYVEPARVLFGVALLETEAEARDFLAALDAGEVFADLARARSIDEATAQEGGVAGWVEETKAIPQLRGEPFGRPAGSTGGPLALDDNWLVYRILDRVPAQPIPVEQAAEAIRTTLTERKSGERMDAWEEQLRAATTVRVNDGALRKAGKQLAAEQQERFREPPPVGHGRGHP